MQKLLFVFLLTLIGSAAIAQQQTGDGIVHATSPQPITGKPYAIQDGDVLEVSVKQKQDGSFYYEILVNGAVTFRQEDCPGKPAGTGFPTQSAAQKVGERVVLKLRRPVAPPIVTADEMERYGLQ